MIKKDELNDLVSSFRKQVEAKKESQVNTEKVQSMARKMQYYFTLLTNEQRWKFIQLMEEKIGNKLTNSDNEAEIDDGTVTIVGEAEYSEENHFQNRFSDVWRFLTETDKIEFLDMMEKQISVNNKENGIQASNDMTRSEFITELSRLLLNKTQDNKVNATLSRILIELLMTANLSMEEVEKDKFMQSRLFGIESLQTRLYPPYISRGTFNSYSDLLSIIASNPMKFFSAYDIDGILVGNEVLNFSDEEAKILYENVLQPYYEILGLKGNVPRNYNFSDLTFVKTELEYQDGYDTMEFTPKELSVVSELLKDKLQSNKRPKKM